METVIAIVSIVLAVLNIILFFKIWGMTNNVKDIKTRVAEHLLTEKEIEWSGVLSRLASKGIYKGAVVIENSTGKEMTVDKITRFADGSVGIYCLFNYEYGSQMFHDESHLRPKSTE